MTTPPVTMDQKYLELMKQMIELKQENISLRKQMLCGQSNMSRVRKPDRPLIALDATDGDWALFIDEWTQYKDMCGLKDSAVIRNELRSACTPETNRLLFELIGPEALNTATEEHLLQQIRLVAVKRLHKKFIGRTFTLRGGINYTFSSSIACPGKVLRIYSYLPERSELWLPSKIFWRHGSRANDSRTGKYGTSE